MISRIRVDVRAASMEEAEREAMIVIDHARMAGYLEGVVPQSSKITDHHFGSASVKRGGHDPEDLWSDLGGTFEGRVTCTFQPCGPHLPSTQPAIVEVIQEHDFTPHGLSGHVGSEHTPIREDITQKSIVLERIRSLEPESSWGIGPTVWDGATPWSGGDAPAEEELEMVIGKVSPSPMDVLSKIQVLPGFLSANMTQSSVFFGILVRFEDPVENIEAEGANMAEAVVDLVAKLEDRLHTAEVIEEVRRRATSPGPK